MSISKVKQIINFFKLSSIWIYLSFVNLWTECLCQLKFIFWNPNPPCDGFRRWSLKRQFGHEGGALINEISALIKGTPETSITPSAVRRHYLWCRKPASPDAKSTRALMLDVQPPELWKVNVCCLDQPVYGILLYQLKGVLCWGQNGGYMALYICQNP